jgi:hypothetical protein
MIYRSFSGIFMKAARYAGLSDTGQPYAKERIECQSKSKLAIQPIAWLLLK